MSRQRPCGGKTCRGQLCLGPPGDQVVAIGVGFAMADQAEVFGWQDHSSVRPPRVRVAPVLHDALGHASIGVGRVADQEPGCRIKGGGGERR